MWLRFILPVVLATYNEVTNTCSDWTIGLSCFKGCNEIMLTCKFDCLGDADCEYTCSNQFNQCQDQCPCYRNCLNGCNGCWAHATCNCVDPDSNPDFLACSNEAQVAYFICINECPVNDLFCVSTCGRTYERLYERCPCQELCPG